MKLFAVAAMVAVVGSAALVMGQAGGPATAPAVEGAATQASAFKTDAERIGYAIGLQVGSKLNGVDVDANALAAGVHDAATGAKPRMTDDEIRATIDVLRSKMEAQMAKADTENVKAGEAFLAENGKKEGVKTTASGLQYKVITSGSGKTPKATDTVSVNYKGTLITGKVFDESHGTPVTFPVNGVIPGWTEALQLMKEGDKWTLYLPSKLAYGPEGTPDGSIPPNSVLVFDVELLSVK